MSNHPKSKATTTGLTRRDFVKVAGLTAAASAAGLVHTQARAELVKLDEKDPTAGALGYVHDASTVSAEKRPEGRICGNCALFAGGVDEKWAGCQIFPGKAVANAGWCSVWAPKPG